MKVVDEVRFHALVKSGAIRHEACAFMDGVKIGLRVQPVGKILPETLDLEFEPTTEAFDLRDAPLRPGRLYLLQSVEAISLPLNIFGFLHTRSWIARLGIDCVGSSNFVAPGFGAGHPCSFVLEVTSKAISANLPFVYPMVGLVLFESDGPIGRGKKVNPFPFVGG